MKKTYLFALLLALCTGLQAQKNKLSKEEFRARQEAFITEKAGLTPQEAGQFFTLYFELQDKKENLHRKAWQELRKGRKSDLNEKEYGQIIENVIQSRISVDQLDLEYLRKYQKFLSNKKIYDIQRAEMRFHRELIKSQRK